MSKLLLVDDEDLVRIMVRTIIESGKYGIDEILEAQNGKRALELMENNCIDILLTDIRMPQMDGMELIASVKKLYPNVVCIVMTAYDEFDYARNALRLGVVDFLSKDELNSDSIRKLMFMIQEKSLTTHYKNEVSQEVLQSELFNDLIEEKLKQEDFYKLIWSEFNGKMKQNMVVCKIRIDERMKVERLEKESSEEDSRRMYKSFYNLCQNVLRNSTGAHLFTLNEKTFVVLNMFDSIEGYQNIHNTIQLLIRKIREVIINLTDVLLSIGISDIGSNIVELYSQASYSLSFFVQFGHDKNIFYKDVCRLKVGHDFAINFVEFQSMLGKSDTEQIKKYFDQLLVEMKSANIIDIKEIYENYMKILVLTNQYLSRQGLSLEHIFKLNIDFNEKMKRYHTLDEINIWIKNVFVWLFDYIHTNEGMDPKITKIIEYIKVNYKEQISLESMAEYVNLSPNYLSRLFMKSMKQSFIDYLVRFRIERAKDLLRNTDLTIGAVMEAVGYINIYHFSKIFKKTTGVSPREYRIGIAEKQQEMIRNK